MKKLMKKVNSLNKKGFTLIELIVVIAIIAALMLILVPTMNGFVNTAKKQANQANAKAVYTALRASQTAKEAGMTMAGTTTICTHKTDAGSTAIDVYTEFWSGSAVPNCTYTNIGKTIKVTVDTGEYIGS